MAQIGYTLLTASWSREQVRAAMGDAPAAQTGGQLELGGQCLYSRKLYFPRKSRSWICIAASRRSRPWTDARAVRDEFYDRFGTAPNEVENLLGAAVVRAYAARAHIASVIRKGNVIELRFPEDAPIDPGKLRKFCRIIRKPPSSAPEARPESWFKPGKGKNLHGLLGLMEQIQGVAYPGSKSSIIKVTNIAPPPAETFPRRARRMRRRPEKDMGKKDFCDGAGGGYAVFDYGLPYGLYQ